MQIVESILRASNTFTPGGSLLQMLNRDLQGNTLLHEAIEGGYTDVVKLLLEAWEKDSDYFQKSYGRSISTTQTSQILEKYCLHSLNLIWRTVFIFIFNKKRLTKISFVCQF